MYKKGTRRKAAVLNPFRAPNPLPIRISSTFVQKRKVSSCKSVKALELLPCVYREPTSPKPAQVPRVAARFTHEGMRFPTSANTNSSQKLLQFLRTTSYAPSAKAPSRISFRIRRTSGRLPMKFPRTCGRYVGRQAGRQVEGNDTHKKKKTNTKKSRQTRPIKTELKRLFLY